MTNNINIYFNKVLRGRHTKSTISLKKRDKCDTFVTKRDAT